MRELKIGKHNVQMYDGIEDLPMKRFHKYNKMLLVESSVGSSIADIDTHIVKAISFINVKKNVEAVTELNNLRQNVMMMQNGISPKMLAFAILVKSIDGKECNDISDSGLQKTLSYFEDATIAELATSLEEVKKKIDLELVLYFSNTFEDASTKEFYDILKKRTNCILEGVANNTTEESEQEKELTTQLLTFNSPLSFTGKDNAEILHDKNYERMCVIISQHLHTNPKEYTVIEFYNAFEYVQEYLKAQEKANKSRIKR